MAQQEQRKGILDVAAATIGRTIGHVANQIDKLPERREQMSEMLDKARSGVQAEIAVVKDAVRSVRKTGADVVSQARRAVSTTATTRQATVKKSATKTAKKAVKATKKAVKTAKKSVKTVKKAAKSAKRGR